MQYCPMNSWENIALKVGVLYLVDMIAKYLRHWTLRDCQNCLGSSLDSDLSGCFIVIFIV